MSVDQVKTLAVGSRINIKGQDEAGILQSIECIVAMHGGKKFLTYRIKGDLKRCAIKEYPGKYYAKPL